ncbi:MAG: type III-B CRISPR-associated protein Cas10/Cmr2 [Candidatus Electrothrix scaldis]|nr:MAG: type III-B CRISPR-associated protein Cas10/Cmr2 [Candidatus Electrothrix sp. GW3-3]
MSDQETWLISLSIGPVQDFISAALRTRDLWFGSYMLSEVSKAAAIAIKKYSPDAIDLIFPAAENSEELKPDEVNVANRIVVQVQGNEEMMKVALAAGKKAAKLKLTCLIEQAKSKAPISLRDDIWEIQAKPEDLLELYGTAARIKDKDYQEAWKRLGQLNSARKNSRDFQQSVAEPNDSSLYGLPKSSLDGRRETVLPEGLDKKIRRRLRMGEGEQLDVMGLVKRLAGGEVDEQKQFNPTAKLQFTPTTRIAIDPWIRKVLDDPDGKGKAKLKKIHDTLKTHQQVLMNSGLITKVQGNEEIYKDMPFDAGLLYRSVLDANIQKSIREERSGDENLLRKLRKEVLQEVWKEYGQPCPYYALLLADGDRMGALIKAAQDKDHHKEISKCLSKFAQSVPDTARRHQAHCIYSGGDDVLLMAPLDKVLDLADKLRRDFKEALQSIAKKIGQDAPTFSVGIVIAHMQTPIGRVRRLASKAERLAKDGARKTDPQRNALAITVAPRSGADISFRANWDKTPVAKLDILASLYRDDKLPSGFGYELRQINQLVHDMKNKEKAGEIAELEMRRILNRKNQGGGGEKVTDDTINNVLAHAQQKQEDNDEIFDIESVYKEHLIARWLGAHGEERG